VKIRLRCDQCRCKAVAFAPGTEPERVASIRVDRGIRPRAWCRACWLAEFGEHPQRAPPVRAREFANVP
jgi:hypothetical protein